MASARENRTEQPGLPVRVSPVLVVLKRPVKSAGAKICSALHASERKMRGLPGEPVLRM